MLIPGSKTLFGSQQKFRFLSSPPISNISVSYQLHILLLFCQFFFLSVSIIDPIKPWDTCLMYCHLGLFWILDLFVGHSSCNDCWWQLWFHSFWRSEIWDWLAGGFGSGLLMKKMLQLSHQLELHPCQDRTEGLVFQFTYMTDNRSIFLTALVREFSSLPVGFSIGQFSVWQLAFPRSAIY